MTLLDDREDDRPAPAAARPPGNPLLATLRVTARNIADFVLPPLCPGCRRPVLDDGGLCEDCWSGLDLIEQPICDVFGVPLAYDMGPQGVSPEAIANPPTYDRARAAMAFGPVARKLVHALKYRDRLETAQIMARAMARAGSEILPDADGLVPIPLHRSRLFARRYNQAAILAQAIAALATPPVRVDLTALVRTRATLQQVGLSAKQRRRNVGGAFRASYPERVAGRRLVLVDDVLTSGATASAAAQALRTAGAARVDVLVFARVLGGDGDAL